MRCPYCANEDTRVIDSRLGDSAESVRRRRECQTCTQRFTTVEHVVFKVPMVVKSDGRREKFQEEKLRRGIMLALEKRAVALETVEGAINRIMKKFSHRDEREVLGKKIGEVVMAELRQIDEVAYVRFASVYRRFQDLEDFSDELQKLKDSPSAQENVAQRTIILKSGKA